MKWFIEKRIKEFTIFVKNSTPVISLFQIKIHRQIQRVMIFKLKSFMSFSSRGIRLGHALSLKEKKKKWRQKENIKAKR